MTPEADFRLRHRHLLGIEPLDADEIRLILDTAESFLEISRRPIKKVPTLRGRTIVNLFMEPSTRTRSSFEIAEKRLSADSLSFSPSSSSVSKGETLLDTARNLEAMAPDMIIIRHASAGAPHLLARICRSNIVNAGDGAHEHPTQALLDAFTMRQKKGKIGGLRVAIVGDITNSRVVRSNLFLLKKLGATVVIGGPPTLLPVGLDRLGVEVKPRIEQALEGCDVVMMLRVQQERMTAAYFPSVREYSRRYGLDAARMARLPEHAIVMHPGPMNRGVEIAAEVADSVRSTIVEQVANGVTTRMAVLYLLLGGTEFPATGVAR